jgi:hypothetical protein
MESCLYWKHSHLPRIMIGNQCKITSNNWKLLMAWMEMKSKNLMKDSLIEPLKSSAHISFFTVFEKFIWERQKNSSKLLTHWVGYLNRLLECLGGGEYIHQNSIYGCYPNWPNSVFPKMMCSIEWSKHDKLQTVLAQDCLEQHFLLSS